MKIIFLTSIKNIMFCQSKSFAADFGAISFGLWLRDPSFREVLDPIMGRSPDRENYRIAADSPEKGYIEYGSDEFVVTPGQTYWFLAKYGPDVSVTGVPVSTETDIHVGLEYDRTSGDGWNLIASPNDADYSWDDVEVVVYDESANIVFGSMAIGKMTFPNDYIDNKLWQWGKGEYFLPEKALIKRNQGCGVTVKSSGVYLKFPVKAQIKGLGNKYLSRRVSRQ